METSSPISSRTALRALIALAACLVVACAGDPEPRVVSRSTQALTPGGDTPWPVDVDGTPKWDGTYAELLAADALAACWNAMHIDDYTYSTVGGTNDGDALFSHLAEKMAGSACFVDIDGNRLSSRNGSSSDYNLPTPGWGAVDLVYHDWIVGRGKDVCNVDETTGEGASVQLALTPDDASIYALGVQDVNTDLLLYAFVNQCMGAQLREQLNSPKVAFASEGDLVQVQAIVRTVDTSAATALTAVIRRVGAGEWAGAGTPVPDLAQLGSDYRATLDNLINSASDEVTTLLRSTSVSNSFGQPVHDRDADVGLSGARVSALEVLYGLYPWNAGQTDEHTPLHAPVTSAGDIATQTLLRLARAADALVITSVRPPEGWEMGYLPGAGAIWGSYAGAVIETHDNARSLLEAVETYYREQQCEEPGCDPLPAGTDPDDYRIAEEFGIQEHHAVALVESLAEYVLGTPEGTPAELAAGTWTYRRTAYAGSQVAFPDVAIVDRVGPGLTVEAMGDDGVGSVHLPAGFAMPTSFARLPANDYVSTALPVDGRDSSALDHRDDKAVLCLDERLSRRLSLEPALGCTPLHSKGVVAVLAAAREVLAGLPANDATTIQSGVALPLLDAAIGSRTMRLDLDALVVTKQDDDPVSDAGLAVRLATGTYQYETTESGVALALLASSAAGYQVRQAAFSSVSGPAHGLFLAASPVDPSDYIRIAGFTALGNSGDRVLVSGGALTRLVDDAFAPDPTDWSRPKYDAFGLATDWVPTGDASLHGGSPGEETYQYFLRVAKSAAEDATSAIQTAFSSLQQEAEDVLALKAADAKAEGLAEIEQKSLCGDAADCDLGDWSQVNIEGETPPAGPPAWDEITCQGVSKEPHEYEGMPTDNGVVQRRRQQPAPWDICAGRVRAIEDAIGGLDSFYLAPPVAAGLDENLPSFPEFEGSEMAAALIEQSKAYRHLRSVVDSVRATAVAGAAEWVTRREEYGAARLNVAATKAELAATRLELVAKFHELDVTMYANAIDYQNAQAQVEQAELSMQQFLRQAEQEKADTQTAVGLVARLCNEDPGGPLDRARIAGFTVDRKYGEDFGEGNAGLADVLRQLDGLEESKAHLTNGTGWSAGPLIAAKQACDEANNALWALLRRQGWVDDEDRSKKLSGRAVQAELENLQDTATRTLELVEQKVIAGSALRDAIENMITTRLGDDGDLAARSEAVDAQEGVAASTLLEGYAQAAVTLQSNLVSVIDAMGGLASANARIARVQQQAKLATARVDVTSEIDAEALRGRFAIKRRYQSYDLWRARALAENARRLGVAARRAIEGRFVVDLSGLDEAEPFVEAPSLWADEIYASDLKPPAALGTVAGPSGGSGIYSNKLVDYVRNLELFVQGYAVARPTSIARADTEVIQLVAPSNVEHDVFENGDVARYIDPDSAGWFFYCPKFDAWIPNPNTGYDIGQADFSRACNGEPPTKASTMFWLDPWGRPGGFLDDEPYEMRHNVRWGRFSMNLVGAGIRDCSLADDPQACYAEPFIRYDLEHVGPAMVTDYREQWHSLGMPIAVVEGGKALASEEWLDPVSRAFNVPSVSNVSRVEYRGRPIGGVYRLTLDLTADVRPERIERIQLLAETDYWVRQLTEDDTDPDVIEAVCGNGILEPTEVCEHALGDGGMPMVPDGGVLPEQWECPESCNDNDVCTTDDRLGSAILCTAECVNTPITTCVSGDGCCPAGCYGRDGDNHDADCAVDGNPLVSWVAGEFSNASSQGGLTERYAWDAARDTMYGPFEMNEPAIVERDGRNYVQIEGGRVNFQTYSGELDQFDACFLGDASGDAEWPDADKAISAPCTGSSATYIADGDYAYSVYARHSGTPVTTSLGVAEDVPGFTWSDNLTVSAEWARLDKQVTVTGVGTPTSGQLTLSTETGFVGWGLQFEPGAFPSSPIPTGASPLSRMQDELRIPAAQIPEDLRTGIWQMHVIPYFASDDEDAVVYDLITFAEPAQQGAPPFVRARLVLVSDDGGTGGALASLQLLDHDDGILAEVPNLQWDRHDELIIGVDMAAGRLSVRNLTPDPLPAGISVDSGPFEIDSTYDMWIGSHPDSVSGDYVTTFFGLLSEPAAATYSNGYAAVCDDGLVEAGEDCDDGPGSETTCPTQLDDCGPSLECMEFVSAGSCLNGCQYAPDRACVSGDNCCATGCTPDNDYDCADTLLSWAGSEIMYSNPSNPAPPEARYIWNAEIRELEAGVAPAGQAAYTTRGGLRYLQVEGARVNYALDWWRDSWDGWVPFYSEELKGIVAGPEGAVSSAGELHCNDGPYCQSAINTYISLAACFNRPFVLSAFVKRAPMSVDTDIRLSLEDTANGKATVETVAPLPDAWTRLTTPSIVKIGDGTGNGMLRNAIDALDVSAAFGIWNPQQERGTFPTSPIRGPQASGWGYSTRPADYADVDLSQLPNQELPAELVDGAWRLKVIPYFSSDDLVDGSGDAHVFTFHECGVGLALVMRGSGDPQTPGTVELRSASGDIVYMSFDTTWDRNAELQFDFDMVGETLTVAGFDTGNQSHAFTDGALGLAPGCELRIGRGLNENDPTDGDMFFGLIGEPTVLPTIASPAATVGSILGENLEGWYRADKHVLGAGGVSSLPNLARAGRFDLINADTSKRPELSSVDGAAALDFDPSSGYADSLGWNASYSDFRPLGSYPTVWLVMRPRTSTGGSNMYYEYTSPQDRRVRFVLKTSGDISFAIDDVGSNVLLPAPEPTHLHVIRGSAYADHMTLMIDGATNEVMGLSYQGQEQLVRFAQIGNTFGTDPLDMAEVVVAHDLTDEQIAAVDALLVARYGITLQ